MCVRTHKHTHTHEIHQIASRSQIGLWKSKVPPKVCGNPWKILSFSYDLMLYLPLLPFPAFPSLPRRRHHILQFTQKKQQDHSHWHARVVDFTGEFWGPPWKAIHKPLSSGASLLLFLFSFSSIHPLHPGNSWAP